MVSNSVCLIVDIFLLIVCILQISANLLVLFIWAKSRRLRESDHLILLISLAFIDFVYAVLQFPYLVILIAGWKQNGVYFNYNPWVIVPLGGPSAALMKSGCTVTSFIAIDRLAAIYFPGKYYASKKRRSLTLFITSYGGFNDPIDSYSWNFRWHSLGFIFSIFMALVDWLILQLTVTIEEKPSCSSFGCFTSKEFRVYWGLSNMFVNLFSCVLTLLIIYHLFRNINPQQEAIEKLNKAKIDKSANRVALYILLVSALIGVVPGCLNGVGTIVQIPMLDEISFFVGTSATLSGLSHAFIFAMAHREIKATILKTFRKKTTKISKVESTSFSRSHA